MSENNINENLFIITVVGAMFDDKGRILLQQRKESGLWELPGGKLEVGESIEEGVAREVLEETGLQVCASDVIKVYSEPTKLATYFDVTYQFVVVLLKCTITGGKITKEYEDCDIRFFNEEEACNLPLHRYQYEKIVDAYKNYKNTKSMLNKNCS